MLGMGRTMSHRLSVIGKTELVWSSSCTRSLEDHSSQISRKTVLITMEGFKALTAFGSFDSRANLRMTEIETSPNGLSDSG